MDSKHYASLTATQIADGVRKKSFSAREITDAALAQAHALDPKLKAFVTLLDDRARAAAKAADEAVAAGKNLKLAGVPVALKDNLCVTGTRTTCSSKILENYVPPYTATAVQRILDEGGIPIGKTNLDEFAMGSSTENSAFFTTRNPWDTERVPGGSSGGSAAAVAARIAPLALGSDTGGSIRQPAALCGVTGFKPTYGRISRYGLIAFASSLDQIGPFSRTAIDAALITAVMGGKDPQDATSATRPIESELFNLQAPASLKGIRLGIPKEYFIAGTDPEVDKAIRAAIETYRGLGAELVDVSLPNTEHAVSVYYIVATAEASSNLARFDGVHYGHRTSEKVGLVDLYSKSRAEGFGPEVKRRIMLGTYALSSGYYDAYYLKAQKVRSLIRNDFTEAFKKCDAIICPTSPTPAFKIGEKSADPLSMYLSDIFTISANLAAIPGISIPCGQTSSGLPIGLQLMGEIFDEVRLLKIAAAFQAATKFHEAAPNLA
ncbi:MAG TPA: Asp-tRNA(Asn)/Glu-tRNA(Gln) amidotransferase subunit GatA [Planctomycetota bacterium]|nr:Asp-tRNA(Asn)/Glu-tRNA(Gln) amidotransferase subunit GatA [Planctomycetota bacterium]